MVTVSAKLASPSDIHSGSKEEMEKIDWVAQLLARDPQFVAKYVLIVVSTCGFSKIVKTQ